MIHLDLHYCGSAFQGKRYVSHPVHAEVPVFFPIFAIAMEKHLFFELGKALWKNDKSVFPLTVQFAKVESEFRRVADDFGQPVELRVFLVLLITERGPFVRNPLGKRW